MKKRLGSLVLAMTVTASILGGCSSSESASGSTNAQNQEGKTSEDSLHNGVDISKHRELTVVTFSGSFQDIQEKNLAKSGFEEEYNCDVIFVEAEGNDELELLKNKEVDVFYSDFMYTCEGETMGLFEKLTVEDVPNIANLYDFAIYSDYTLIHDVGAYGIAYNPDLVEEVPEHWVDLWKEEYAGKLMLRPFRADSIELMVYMAKLEGGDEKNMDAGFAKMAEIAPSVHTWSTSHSTTLELFRSGDISVGMWTDGRVAWAKEQGVDLEFVMPEEGGFSLVTTINAVKGTGNEDLAKAYINMELSAECQTTQGEELGYFPMNKDAYDMLSDNAKKMMAFTPEIVENGGVLMCDWPYVVTVYDQWAERWEKEVMSKSVK